MDPFDWMLSDLLQHRRQIILGIEGIQLRGLGQRVDCSGAFTTAFFRLSDNPQLLLAGPAATTLPDRDGLYRAG